MSDEQKKIEASKVSSLKILCSIALARISLSNINLKRNLATNATIEEAYKLCLEKGCLHDADGIYTCRSEPYPASSAMCKMGSDAWKIIKKESNDEKPSEKDGEKDKKKNDLKEVSENEEMDDHKEENKGKN